VVGADYGDELADHDGNKASTNCTAHNHWTQDCEANQLNDFQPNHHNNSNQHPGYNFHHALHDQFKNDLSTDKYRYHIFNPNDNDSGRNCRYSYDDSNRDYQNDFSRPDDLVSLGTFDRIEA